MKRTAVQLSNICNDLHNASIYCQRSAENRRQFYELVLEKGWLTKDELDDMFKPENMTQPRNLSK